MRLDGLSLAYRNPYVFRWRPRYGEMHARLEERAAQRKRIAQDLRDIGQELLVNAFRHSRASRIEVEVEYAPKRFRIVVRDDGCGIDPQVLRAGREGRWGLPRMCERAERVGAGLRVWSRAAGGDRSRVVRPQFHRLRIPNGREISRVLGEFNGSLPVGSADCHGRLEIASQ
jgi:signal transduction histidine kinase